MTDEWKGYTHLSKHGFIHRTVPHKKGYVNKKNPFINTNKIERYWGILKSFIKKPGMKLHKIEKLVARFLVLYRGREKLQTQQKRNKSYEQWELEKIHNFLHIIADVYAKS